MVVRRRVLLLLAALLAAGCSGEAGDSPDPPSDEVVASSSSTASTTTTPPGPVDGVVVVRPGVRSEEITVSIASAGARTVVATVDSLDPRGWVLDVDGSMEEASFESPFLNGAVAPLVAAGPDGGFVAAGHDPTRRIVRIWRSVDGVDWTATFPEGLGSVTSIDSLLADENALILVGSESAPLGRSPSVGRIWESRDRGATWGVRGGPLSSNVVATAAVFSGDALVLTGRAHAVRRLWAQQPDGRLSTHPPTDEPPLVGEYVGVASDADRIVAVGIGPSTGPAYDAWGEQNHGVVVGRSDDGGVTWTEGSLEPASLEDGAEPTAAIGYAAGSYWMAIERRERVHQSACYVDFDSCVRPAGAALFRSADGASWSEIDLSGLLADEVRAIDAIGEDGAGRLVLAGWTDELFVATVDVDEAPFRDLAVPPPTDGPIEIIPWSSALPVGETFARPIASVGGYGAFGDLDGGAWRMVGFECDLVGDEVQVPFRRDDLPIHAGALYGLVTRTDDDLIEYSLPDGEVLATYERGVMSDPPCGSG